MNLPSSEILTIAGLTLTFYSLFGNILFKCKNKFVKQLFGFNILNILISVLVILLILFSMLSEYNFIVASFILLLTSWILAFMVIVLFILFYYSYYGALIEFFLTLFSALTTKETVPNELVYPSYFLIIALVIALSLYLIFK